MGNYTTGEVYKLEATTTITTLYMAIVSTGGLITSPHERDETHGSVSQCCSPYKLSEELDHVTNLLPPELVAADPQ